MNKIDHALAMLAPGGQETQTRRAGRGKAFAAFAAATAGTLMIAPLAHASTLYGYWVDPNDGFDDAFTLDSTAGVADPAPDDIDFPLLTDAYGYTGIEFGDGTTGYKEDGDGFVGIGVYTPGSGVSTNKIDSIDPAAFSGVLAGFTLQPGLYYGDFAGSELLLTLTPLPEPDAWALLIAGAGMVGGVMRARRRQLPAMA
jgi:hypothetical protein